MLGSSANLSASPGYKPYQSTGEDFLQNYLGMIGLTHRTLTRIPHRSRNGTSDGAGEVRSGHPNQNQDPVYVQRGGDVVITSGLLKQLKVKGIQQIADPARQRRRTLVLK